MTADNLNNAAWLAANADHDRPYEVACSRAIKRLMAENERMKRRIEQDRTAMAEAATKLTMHAQLTVHADVPRWGASAQLNIEQPGLI